MSKVYDDKGNFLMEIDSNVIAGSTKQQPTAGDFTSNVRLNIGNWESAISDDVRVRTIIKWLEQACKTIDRAEAELKAKDELIFAYESVHAPINPLLAINKDLLDACEMMLDELVIDYETRDFAIVAIAKAKKEG